jgi:mRNA interferase RelE/StbE
VIAAAARRQVAKLGQSEQRRIDAKIRSLAENPRRPGVEKLTDAGDQYRVRVGQNRIVYAIDDKARIVTVKAVRGRDDIYRKR